VALAVRGASAQDAIAVLVEYRKDPVLFVEREFGVKPDAWQADVLRMYPKTRRLAMQACVGPGKSAVLSWICLNFLVTRPKPKIVCTAITWPNLRDNLWTEFAKWIEKSRWLSQVIQWGQTKISLKENPQQAWIAARTWDRSADTETQGKTLSGLHADYILAIADETGGMPVAVVQSAEGVLSTAREGHIIQAGNPTHLSGALYEATERSGGLWKTYRVTGDPDDPKRSSRVDKDWAREQIRIWGRESAFVRSKILGKYPNQATDALVGLSQMEDSFGREMTRKSWTRRATSTPLVPCVVASRRLAWTLHASATTRPSCACATESTSTTS
jgi:hypothetical protein